MQRKKIERNSLVINNYKNGVNKYQDMLEQTRNQNSKKELLLAIQRSGKRSLEEKNLKTPSQILMFIEENNETIESLAIKTEVSEREILLAIRDVSDRVTRKKIAEALNTTFYSVFGK